MEVKHMPPLEMGKATCRWIIRASGHSKKPRPKRFFKNSHQGGVKNNELIPKTFGGGGHKGLSYVECIFYNQQGPAFLFVQIFTKMKNSFMTSKSHKGKNQEKFGNFAKNV